MKRWIRYLCLFGIVCSAHTKTSWQTARSTIAAALVSCGAYRWWHTPQPIAPTPENLFLYTLTPLHDNGNQETAPVIRSYIAQVQNNSAPNRCTVQVRSADKQACSYTTIYRGVPDSLENPPMIFLLCRGHVASRSRAQGRPGAGGGLLSAYTWLRDGIAHCPIVAFDYQDSRWSLNFGQELDCAYTVLVYAAIQEKYPNTPIVLVGESLGCLRIVQFAATNPPNLAGLVLFAPFLTINLYIDQLYTHWLPSGTPHVGKSLVKFLFHQYCCNYNPEKPDIFAAAAQIKNLSIFIGQRAYDNVTPQNGLQEFIAALRKQNTIHCHITPDTTHYHSHLNQVQDVQEALNAFYQQHAMPCSRKLLCH